MKRISLIIALALCICNSVFAQGHPGNRPSVYQQVDYVRHELNLTQKQYEKLYSAYEEYNNAVFGNNDSQAPSNRPHQGGHHGGFGPGGGPGGPGGPGGGNFGGPGGNPPAGKPEGLRPEVRPDAKDMNRPPQNGSFKPDDLEKLEKTKAKQEEKLRKSVKKILNKDDALFSRWERIREAQLKELFPQPPRFPNEKRLQ